MKGRTRPKSDPLGHCAVKVSSARFKGKLKPHLHVKNCLMLYLGAGGLTLLFFIYVPGLAMPSVSMDQNKRCKALTQGGT